jgi:aminoglycoside phosphotransferase (APT) family kinase protein
MIVEPDWERPINGGNQSRLFECGPDVCKLYSSQIGPRAKRMAIREARALRMAELFDDVPAPRLRGVRLFKEGWGVIMTRIPGKDFARILADRPEAKQELLNEMAGHHIAIHLHQAPRLPLLKCWLSREIRKAEKADTTLPAGALLQRLTEMPDGDRLCHGDFHFSNVIGELGSASVIDWPSAMRGQPAADVCQSWLLMQRTDPGLADAYVEAYASKSGVTVKDVRDWRPVVAGARLGDNVPHEVGRLRQIVAEGLAQ